MNVWAKMITALRGGVNEAGEAIVDSQALRILDQELRDAADELKQSKDSLAAIIAREKLTAEKAGRLKESIAENEGYAVKALEKGDEKLALDVAEKIADLETQLKLEEETGAGYKSSADDLRSAIQAAERDITRMKQQVDTVKATDSVQRAQAAVSERHSGSDSRLRTAIDSLERIKERQDLRSAQMSAARDLANDLGDESLENRLEKAGIKPHGKSAEDVLARLKKNKSGE
ncbi:MAG: PspA/IM30 family protein [Gammaproteobacteria bacterium]